MDLEQNENLDYFENGNTKYLKTMLSTNLNLKKKRFRLSKFVISNVNFQPEILDEVMDLMALYPYKTSNIRKRNIQ